MSKDSKKRWTLSALRKGDVMKKKTYIHTYAMLLMSERGLSQTALAERAGVSLVTVNQILLGRRVSARVQESIAISLGFSNWESLESAAAHFSELFSSIYNRPTTRPRASEESNVG